MKTTVKNLLTGKEDIFINDLSLTENIVNSIIVSKNMTSNLLNDKIREKIKKDYTIIESFSKITGNKFAHCIELDLHASNR